MCLSPVPTLHFDPLEWFVIMIYTCMHFKKPSRTCRITFYSTIYHTTSFDTMRVDGPDRGASNCSSLTTIGNDSFRIYTASMLSYASDTLARHPGKGHWLCSCCRRCLGQHRVHSSCLQHTMVFRFNEVHSTVEHGCLDLPSSGGPR